MNSKRKNLFVFAAALAVLCVAGFFLESSKRPENLPRSTPAYAEKLFNTDKVHKVDISIPQWEEMLANAEKEEYYMADITIDGETVQEVAIRVKGNNSRRLTQKYGHSRYSLKIKFDHYVKGLSYHGLDKMCLDSSFQDNSYMKTAISFDMMNKMGVVTPLYSYAWVTVNGRDWGLFVAVEEPETAFARRNWGNDHGNLYKPDYKNLEDENNDVALKYTGDSFENYDNIFRKSKFDITNEDKTRLINALKILSTGENLETAVDINRVINYFVVQSFVVNMDSYLGKTGHNYFLHEKDGIISILPWDYNLAFATYSLGMPNPINDAELYVNYPINTPAAGEVMLNRPLYHNLMKNKDYFARYHARYDWFIENYFDSGYFADFVADTKSLIGPYVQKDPTAFCNYDDFLLGVDTIENFCNLRAESVRRQLRGIIPATIRGQRKDKSNFVDASSVWLPDMGEIADLKD